MTEEKLPRNCSERVVRKDDNIEQRVDLKISTTERQHMDFTPFIRDIPDFPKPGIFAAAERTRAQQHRTLQR